MQQNQQHAKPVEIVPARARVGITRLPTHAFILPYQALYFAMSGLAANTRACVAWLAHAHVVRVWRKRVLGDTGALLARYKCRKIQSM
jgi:hypothetical protein